MNILFENIKNHDLENFERNLQTSSDDMQEEMNRGCENFKILAIKNLSDAEFERFCCIMKRHYCSKFSR